MMYTTRCSHCQTVFRISAGQLLAHEALVRCGRCLQVFDARPTLAPSALANAAPTSPELAVDAAAESSPAPITAARVPTSSHSVAHPVTDVFAEPVIADAEAIATEPVATRSQGRARRVVAQIGSAIIAIGLCVVLYSYRGQWAAHWPTHKPTLTMVCRWLGCTITLPQAPQLIEIQAVDLQVPDPSLPSRVQMTATLRNNATYSLGFPALDLVLTNQLDHKLAQRTVLPAEYLAADRLVEDGIAAQTEVTVRLDLETGNIGATGFRLVPIAVP